MSLQQGNPSHALVHFGHRQILRGNGVVVTRLAVDLGRSFVLGNLKKKLKKKVNKYFKGF
jgi:hypothetical protein